MSEPDKAEARERGHLYALLATVFRRPLNAAQLDHLRSPPLLDAMLSAGIDPGEDFIRGESNSVLDFLAIDYTNLFHAPADRIVPYEGIQTGKSDRLMGETAHSVREFLSQAGYVVLPEGGELPDHISTELAFMSDLAQREGEALEADDSETAVHAALLQRQFLDKHLGHWAGRFAEKVSGTAGTSFYRGMGELLGRFIAEECAHRTTH
jgi:TorA maturation chaperone TorD